LRSADTESIALHCINSRADKGKSAELLGCPSVADCRIRTQNPAAATWSPSYLTFNRYLPPAYRFPSCRRRVPPRQLPQHTFANRREHKINLIHLPLGVSPQPSSCVMPL